MFIISIILNSAYLYVYRKNIYCDGLLKPHGEIAYNLYKHNSTKINPERAGKLAILEHQTGKRADYYEIDHESYGPPKQYRNHLDTIGYGFLIGLLWKITGSLNYLDIQLLQLLLFSLMLLFFYQIAFMLFGTRQTALFSCIALLLFFPAIFLNVQVCRDIWPFYSSVILIYAICKYLHSKSDYITPTIAESLVGLMQFMRPHSFTLILTTCTVLVGYIFFSKVSPSTKASPSTYERFIKITKLIFIIFATNILFFWVPFMAYNKIAYNRYVVSASGIALIHGLGEFDNPWGYKLDDAWYTEFMEKNYPDLTPLEQEEKTKELFYKAVKENPWYYIRSVLRRIPRFIAPGLPSFNYQDKAEIYHMYMTGTPISKLIKIVTRSPMILFDFVARHLYIGLFLFLAYLGLLLALFKRRFFAFFLLFFGVIATGYSIILIHPDHRYIIPYYTFFAMFVGYLFSEIRRYLLP